MDPVEIVAGYFAGYFGDGEYLRLEREVAESVLKALRDAGWRIVRSSDDDPHYVTFGKDGWAIEHSAACRNAGSMLDCPFDIELRDLCQGPPPQGLGRYSAHLMEHGWDFVPAPDRAETTALLITEEWTPEAPDGR